ncbi:MAG: patatin family protein [Blastocatellia bacterium]|nr:patatin family protein [Blastocatellia bacterium]MDW8257621.1 patatin family protein [Acidobacteriota bacterium]
MNEREIDRARIARTIQALSDRVAGLRPETALHHILERKLEREAQRWTPRSLKTACVLQGGAMRGVASAGAIIALEQLGFTEAFDAVYGASAGAINGAYFLAGQAAFGTSIYYQDIANRRFINPARLWKIVDMDFLFQEIIARRKRLDLDRVRQNRTPLHIIATEVQTGREVLFSSHDHELDLLAALKASAALPILYPYPVRVGERLYVDGGVVDAIPIERALLDGCTDLLVVLTVPKTHRAKPPSALERMLAARLLRPLSRDLERAFLHRHETYNRALDLALGRRDAPANIVALFLDPQLPLSRLTKDVSVLKRAATQMGRLIFQLFAGEDRESVELLHFVKRPHRGPAESR